VALAAYAASLPAALGGEISSGAVAGSSGCPGRSTLHDLTPSCSVQTGQM
jgi:hypothetical protein